MKVVTVHRGARDNYQVARALSEAGMLEALVTDLYWPADKPWAQALERFVPGGLSDALRCRHADALPSRAVASCWGNGLYSMALSKSKMVAFERQRDAVRKCDVTLGRHAGELATRRGAALLSYSYYGHSAFTHYTGAEARILFQLHPHPARVRAILRSERVLHPQCASSLDKEWELALPEDDFNRLVQECDMAHHWLVASTFSKQTLIDSGLPAERIHVIPYGTDLARFQFRKRQLKTKQPLQLLFVGSLGQRKGITYLLEAVSSFPEGTVQLTMCGRPVDDMKLLAECKVPIQVFPSISAEGLIAAYQAADVFVFPSLAEGFGHVLLEAMASGLPIISTTSTAAPDLITHGKEGYITAPGDSRSLAAYINEFVKNPQKAKVFGEAARSRAEHFTWRRFRQGVVEAVNEILEQPASSR
jgi:glycosyltransferase involved in cell wall biosynthesis